MKKITKIAFRFHSWLGLISGIFLLLLGLSGSALVFRDELDHALNADLLTVKPQTEKLSLDQMYRQICRLYPNLGGIMWSNPGAAADVAYEFRLYQNDGRLSTYDLGLVSMDPYTGKILRKGDLKDFQTGIMPWITQFHWCFQWGVPGLFLATVFGLTMLFSIITGIIIYRKFVWKVMLFKVKINWSNWRLATSGLHRVIGVWTILLNLIIFFTGFWMNKFSFDTAYWQRQQQVMAKNTVAVHSLDSMYIAATQIMPGLKVANVYLPTQPGKDFKLSGTIPGQLYVMANGNSVAFDPATGKLSKIMRLSESTPYVKAEAMVFPLHVGNFGGWFVKICYVIIGLTPGLLSITGAMLWLRRR